MVCGSERHVQWERLWAAARSRQVNLHQTKKNSDDDNDGGSGVAQLREQTASASPQLALPAQRLGYPAEERRKSRRTGSPAGSDCRMRCKHGSLPLRLRRWPRHPRLPVT